MRTAVAAVAVATLSSGCYMASQGEWFDAESVSSLKAGMTRAQVLETLGGPALAYRRDDGAEVWAYQYARDAGIGLSLIIFSVSHSEPESHALTLAFDGEALKTIEYMAYLGMPEKGPLQVHRGQAVELPKGKAKKQGQSTTARSPAAK